MSDIKKSKGFNESFAQFFESPSRDTLRELLRNQTGEYDHLDFKAELLPHDEVAKHILGMANKSRGVIIFGVEENKDFGLNSKGLSILSDKTDFNKGIRNYVPDKLVYDVIDFTYDESEYPKLKGKSFRVVIVEYEPRYIPFLPKKASKKIERNHIYIRHNVSTIQAEYEQLQDIFNRRLETNFSSAREISLMEHLSELKELYSIIKETVIDQDMISSLYNIEEEEDPFLMKNPSYPKEEFEAFVSRMISVKMEIIEVMVRG